MSKKNTNIACTIARRELAAYFTSPMAYIVIGLFLICSGFLFFTTFFLQRRAELREFFELLPLLFSLFIPAITMRIFSEERRAGTIETLFTLPVTVTQIVIGKYIALLAAAASMLVPTLFYVITCAVFGSPDFGPIIGGYIGAVFLAAAFSAIGLFTSSLTKNQIIAFFTAFAVCAVLVLMDKFSIFIPGSLVQFTVFLSASSHFDSVCRGIIDTRDVIYFVSLTVLFITLTVRALNNSKRG